MSSKIEMFTDGACRGNPGPGGWAALLRMGEHEKMLSGSEANTTNNRMEMTAALEGFRALTRPVQVHICTDSQYLLKGVTEWMPGWKKRGWKTASRQPVKNVELWQALDQALCAHQVTWEWVRGHNGHIENERVDEAANQAIDQMLQS